MAYKSSDCFVLKSVNYKDADKIFTLYSKKEGKITAIARGVRKISSKRAGSLDRLNIVNVNFYESSSGFNTITEVKNIESFRNIKNDSDLIDIAYKIVFLVLRHVGEAAPNKVLFDLLSQTLFLLDSSLVVSSAAYAHFLINFMGILGYSLELNKCVVCHRALSVKWKVPAFSYDFGGIVCDNCKKFEPSVNLKTLALLSKARDLQKANFRFYKSGSVHLKEGLDLLGHYVVLKLES